jgi:hypothetical protein
VGDEDLEAASQAAEALRSDPAIRP